MLQDWQTVSATAFAITSIAVAYGVWLNYKKGSRKPLKDNLKPEKWALVGRVSKLVIYPVKSCQGVEVQEAVITKLGLRFRDHNIRDRDFMVVDGNGKMLTMVMAPSMSFISLEPHSSKKDHLVLSAPGMDSIAFTYPDASKSQEKLCRVKHDSNVKALDCGDEVAQWLQDFIGKENLRLYYHHLNHTQRTLEPYMQQCPMFQHSDMGLFHNETSYLLISAESVHDLNTRLEKASTWKNWRPTILIDSVSEPFAEVNWSFVRVGNENGILKAAVPCYRCPIVTIDQEAGVLPKDGEPLKTLRSMNKSTMFADKKVAKVLNNKGIMGLRLGLYLPAGEGAVIKAGDPVYAALL